MRRLLCPPTRWSPSQAFVRRFARASPIRERNRRFKSSSALCRLVTQFNNHLCQLSSRSSRKRTDSSNPPLSATESRVSEILRGTDRKPRAVAAFCERQGTGDDLSSARRANFIRMFSAGQLAGPLHKPLSVGSPVHRLFAKGTNVSNPARHCADSSRS
jgi:hypothetical protein